MNQLEFTKEQLKEYWKGYCDAAPILDLLGEITPEYYLGFRHQFENMYHEFFSEEGYGQAYFGRPYKNPYFGLEGEAFADGYDSFVEQPKEIADKA